MKKISILGLIFAFSGIISAQDLGNVEQIITPPEVSVASLMRFTEIPVDISTGVPNVSIPFVNIPTRSKDITMNIGLGYHPSSVKAAAQPGDCGLGWSLFVGGVISRTVLYNADEKNDYNYLDDDQYQFNFMGYSGTFFLDRVYDCPVYSGTGPVDVLDYHLEVIAFKCDQGNLTIKINFNKSTSKIESFIVNDEKGYQYFFEKFDTSLKWLPTPGIHYPDAVGSHSYRSAHHLTRVLDNNDKELIKFNYKTFNKSLSVEKYNKVNTISIAGYGKVEFTYSESSTVYTPDIRLKELLLKDFNDHPIKKLKLNVNSYLSSVEITDPDGIQKEEYSFSYADAELGYNYKESVDQWGYKNKVSKSYYDEDDLPYRPSPEYCTIGVLDKMALPKGGYIIFDYESNTYSDYIQDTNGAWHIDSNLENYYSTQCSSAYSTSTEIDGNITVTQVKSNQSQPLSNTFSFDRSILGADNENFYFNVNDTLTYTIPDLINLVTGELQKFHPYFILTRGDNPGYEKKLTSENNAQNCGLGEKIDLTPGVQYTITQYPTNRHIGWVTISTHIRNPNPTKWHYGGGIRIKQISYYDLYSSGKPSKVINYDYKLFDNPEYSSGVLAYDSYDAAPGSETLDLVNKSSLVNYRNVTVREYNNGKEQYTYTTPVDCLSSYEMALGGTFCVSHPIFQNGLLSNKKVFNNSDLLINEADITYEHFKYFHRPNSLDKDLKGLFGCSKIKQKKTMDYLNNSVPVTVTESFTYDEVNYNILTHSTTDSVGDTLKKEYVYDTGNAPNHENRTSELKEVKSYRNGTLLLTSTIDYANNWQGNQSYLPKTIKKGKPNNIDIQLNYNKYDEFSNPLEVQQENGIKTVYIWGYNHTKVIAKIVNASYEELESQVENLQTLSNADTNLASEETLREALNDLRANLSNAMVTTYTYDPLVGVTSITDPKGDRITYEYDSFGRLQFVKDKDGNILSENEYHYKN